MIASDTEVMNNLNSFMYNPIFIAMVGIPFAASMIMWIVEIIGSGVKRPFAARVRDEFIIFACTFVCFHIWIVDFIAGN